MDPLTITTGCLSAVATIAKLLTVTTGLINTFRSAKEDLETVSGELTALAICLNKLVDDAGKQAVRLPQTVLDVVHGCDTVAERMYLLLLKVGGGGIKAKARWVMSQKGKIEKLRVTLESHKTAVNVALAMANLQIVQAVADNAAHIPAIRQDVGHIRGMAHEIELLRQQVANLNQGGGGDGLLLQRFLHDAESVIDPEVAESVIDPEFMGTAEDLQDERFSRRSRLQMLNTGNQARPLREDVWIAVMGMKGVGKSTFISTCTAQGSGRDMEREYSHARHDVRGVLLVGYTKLIDADSPEARPDLFVYQNSFNIHFLEMEDLYDDNKSDEEVFQDIAMWFVNANEAFRFAGIIYLHALADNQVRSRYLLNIFMKLCGRTSLPKVVIVTREGEAQGPRQPETWRKITDLDLLFSARPRAVERGLQEPTDPIETMEILDSFVAQRDQHVQFAISTEISQLGRTFEETAAGIWLAGELAEAELQRQRQERGEREAREREQREEQAARAKAYRQRRAREEHEAEVYRQKKREVAEMEARKAEAYEEEERRIKAQKDAAARKAEEERAREREMYEREREKDEREREKYEREREKYERDTKARYLEERGRELEEHYLRQRNRHEAERAARYGR